MLGRTLAHRSFPKNACDLYGLQILGDDFVDLTNSGRRVVTALNGSPAHTKGSWVEFIAATTREYHWIMPALEAASNVSGGAAVVLLDIGIGGAGSEVVIVPNWPVGAHSRGVVFQPLGPWVPVHIPKGSRIAFRTQGNRTTSPANGATLSMTAGQLPVGSRVPSKLVNIGANTATSRGVGIPNSGTNHVESAWVSLGTAPMPLCGVVIGAQLDADTTSGNQVSAVDIGVGASGAQVPIVEEVMGFSTTAEFTNYPYAGPYECTVPAGATLWGRWRTSVVTGGGDLDLALLGIPA